jgi:hypothetical protein
MELGTCTAVAVAAAVAADGAREAGPEGSILRKPNIEGCWTDGGGGGAWAGVGTRAAGGAGGAGGAGAAMAAAFPDLPRRRGGIFPMYAH